MSIFSTDLCVLVPRQGRHIVVLLVSVLALSVLGAAQGDPGSRALDLGIIVMPTLEGAKEIVKELSGGQDFSVLAKEKSIDATAIDGGYLGKVDPAQMRTELRDDIRGHGAGELTDIVQLPSGFAVLKLFPAPPATSDLNPKRLSSLVETGAIRIGPLVSGVTEANLAFQAYAQRNGWDPHDLHRTCEIRTNSLADAKASVKDTLAHIGQNGAEVSPADQIAGHSALAQLYAYSGEMQESIAEWKIAYELAKEGDPAALPNIVESIGTAYLHLSEMDNNVYRGSTDLDIFPPLHPHTSFL